MRTKNIWYSFTCKVDFEKGGNCIVAGKYKVSDIPSALMSGSTIKNHVSIELKTVTLGTGVYSFEALCIDMSRWVLRYEDALMAKIRETELHYAKK